MAGSKSGILLMLMAAACTNAFSVEVEKTPYKKIEAQTLVLPLGKAAETAAAAPVIEPKKQELHKFTVKIEDKTMRQVLNRWAKEMNWVHDQEHWQVQRDLPIIGADSYETEFKTAVRSLLSSSKFTDMPVQPCFHSNRVVRVVAEAELCSKQ